MALYKLLGILVLGSSLTTTFSQTAEEYRLSKNHIPKHYFLDLMINPDLDYFRGYVTITFSTKNTSNSIQLNTSPDILKILKIELNDEDPCNFTTSSTTEIADITCKPIESGENNSLKVTFTGLYKDTSAYGLHKSRYMYNGNEAYFVSTQFEPTYARRAFPCFDEPQLKAEFEVQITHPKIFTALSNTIGHTKTDAGPMVLTSFDKTPVMSPYLLAYAVGNFSGQHSDRSEAGSFPISVYYLPGEDNNITTAIKYGGALIDTHGNFTGIAYNELGNPKMDFLGLPVFIGAMENWGLIIFEDDMLLDHGNQTRPSVKQYLITVIAHELAHQWFGDYVTLDWWSSVWLNEGFATYFQYNFDERFIHTDLETRRQFVVNTLQEVLEVDVSRTQPLSTDEDKIFLYGDIKRKFDTISYSKGGSIIRMMSGILGADNFQKGLHKYLKENAHKNTNPTILLNTLGDFYNGSNHSFRELLHNWIYEAGYPVVNASLSADKKSVQINQEDFYQNTDGTQRSVKWYIPISYTTSIENNFNINVTDWLFDKPLNISVEANSWIIFNLQQTGFYRVNYDKELWYRIIRVLRSSEMTKIHVSTRAQLIDDVFTLADRRKTSFHIAAELAEYVKRETEYEPWYALRRQIVNLLWNVNDSKEKQAIKNLTLSWINEAFPLDKPVNLTTHMQQITNEIITEFRHYLGYKPFLDEAQVVYNQFIISKSMDDYSSRKNALCYGLKLSPTPKKDFGILLNYFKESTSFFERKDILAALGCTTDPEVLKMYLSELISEDSKIFLYDIKDVLKAVYENEENGLDVYLTFLNENLKTLIEKYEDLNMSDFLLKPAQRIVTYNQLSQFKQILEQNKDISSVERFTEEGLKIYTDQIKRQNLNKRDISDFLNKMQLL